MNERKNHLLPEKGNAAIWIIVVIIVLVGGAFFAFSGENSSQGGDDELNTTGATANLDENGMDDEMSQEGETSGEAGIYTDYSPEALENAEGDVVLFFHASWCPFCRGLDESLKSESDEIPSDLTILKIDYDTETALKQKYGVTLQHTLVQVDSDGNQVAKWMSSEVLADILDNLK